MSEMINLKIDGIDVEVPKGTTILQAAKQANTENNDFANSSFQ